MRKKETTLEEYKTYFNNHIEKSENSDCWNWTAATNNIGYGMFRFLGKMQTAHRVQAKLSGIFEEDKYVLHKCMNKLCVNPDHLYAGNMKDMANTRSKFNLGMTGKTHKLAKCNVCGEERPVNIIGKIHNDKCKHKKA